MGKRSGTETVLEILDAFASRRRWRQAELARHVGVEPAALRRHMTELAGKFPLTSVKDHPDVFWEMAAGWHPGGIMLRREDGAALVRILARSPRCPERDLLLKRLLDRQPNVPSPSRVDAAVLSPEESEMLTLVEEAASKQVPLLMRYYSQHAGDTTQRHASVARVLPGPPSRFLAVCHRSGELRYFRVSNIARASLDRGEPFREADRREVERRLAESVDGWFEPAHADVMFTVRAPEARWVARNLPRGMISVPAEDGAIRVTASGAGLAQAARFVVGLGEAAVPETPALAAAVSALAKGALANAADAALHGRSARRIRAEG